MVTYRLLLDSGMAVTPSSKTNDPYTEEVNFDSNMVIILAALLCALLCALGLNTIVRCALRCTRTFGHETADEVALRLASSSLKKEMLSQIPVVGYRPGLHVSATECPICLGEFVEGEDVRVFPRCSHCFHVVCIDRWLVLHPSCPICRQPVIEHYTAANTEHVRIQIR